jgi:hypothetical protein
MRKKIFATGEMAKELQKEAMAIWRMGSNEEYFEGMENDPVISLLMTALAYQEYSADNELSRLKNEVLEDFSRMLIPYELCHARPASVLVQTNTEDSVNMVSLHADTTFSLSITFLSILFIRVLQFRATVIHLFQDRPLVLRLQTMARYSAMTISHLSQKKTSSTFHLTIRLTLQQVFFLKIPGT